jgi:predicted Zn-ribbon and HTH transcriptional regulator
MVTIVKHEWHSHDRQYAIELDESLLSEIYPDLDEDEIAQKLADIESGEVDYEEVINDAYDNDVDIEWEFQYDDCWTDRKGGYDVTYELGDEDSWHTEPEPDPPSHKCTKCRWEGERWNTRTAYVNEQDEVLPDDCEDYHDTKDVCPMCDSNVELTEFGVQAEKERAERQARWDKEEEESEEEPVDEAELARALEELKAEFEALTAHTHHCTECDWTGNEEDIEKEGICPNCCAYVEKYDE